MPHQDGPAYHPVVATLSLGSHTVFHYYRYTAGNKDVPDAVSSDGLARIIDPTPVLSVLLEPRSVVITTGSMYTSHLHGIQERKVDHITQSEAGHPPKFTDLGVDIANWRLLTGIRMKDVVSGGGILERGIRYSLTCRDVEKVANGAIVKR